MIVFDLSCEHGHRFEGWFGSSSDFAAQQESGLLTCPQCGSPDVSKAPMAPAVPVKGNAGGVRTAGEADAVNESAAVPEGARQVSNAPMPPEVAEALGRLADAQAKALKDSKWVGKDFANQSRAMHYGERDHEAIYGEASLKDARDLIDEGVAVAPLPFPVAPPDKIN